VRRNGRRELQPLSRFQTEAQAVLANRTDKRSRFLDAALWYGPEFEPVGFLAGGRYTDLGDPPIGKVTKS
jgi:hypothetical protein